MLKHLPDLALVYQTSMIKMQVFRASGQYYLSVELFILKINSIIIKDDSPFHLIRVGKLSTSFSWECGGRSYSGTALVLIDEQS
jgi:hypothetical protein